jgi:TonB-linked SusC/RagA family outer membrane protein
MRSKFKWIFTLLVALTMQFSFAQDKTVSGVVSDNVGPIPGANVVVKGTTRSAQTDMDGKYSVKAKQGETLVFSFLGLATQEVKVGASNTISVKMSSGENELKEVVVTGYKTTTKLKSNIAVTSISSGTIENRPDANVLNTVQGQIAGVNITSSNGQPGSKPTVIIRGYSTINGNTDPLYVIDGFPTNADSFRSINPNDIEEFTTLKDAAATSQYGNRGTNGVIIIKTRRAKFGESKTKFRYSSSFGVAELQTPKYNYASAKELLTIEKRFGVGTGAGLTDQEIASFTTNTNWVNEFFGQASTNVHNISVENSSKNMSSFTSLGYTSQEGILNTTKLQRFNLRNNINGKTDNDKFKYQVNTSFNYSKNNEATSLGAGAINRNYVLGAYISAPYLDPNQYQIDVANGIFTGTQSEWTLDFYNTSPGLLATPYMLLDKLNTFATNTDEQRFDVSTEFSYQLLKDINVKTRLNGLYQTQRFFQAEFPNSFNGLLFSSTPGVTSQNGGDFNGFEDINQRREVNFNNLWQVEYSKDYKKHSVSANINMEYNAAFLNTNNFRQRGLNPLTFVPNTGAGYVTDIAAHDFYVPQISASNLKYNLISYFSILDYDYDSKYGFGATVRRDGTSRFLDGTRWGTYWSVSGRWNLDKEFTKISNVFDALKLRASYGTTGNERIVDGSVFSGIVPPTYVDSFGISNNTYGSGFGSNLGNPWSLGYPFAKWETTTQANAGFDFSTKKSKLTGSLDFYHRKTVDLFNDEPISAVVGASTIRRNSDANITNKGVEFNITYNAVRSNDFNLSFRFNGSYNKNTVDGLVANEGKIITQDGAGYSFITQNGGSIFEPYVYSYLGVNPANGNLLFEDINGNPTENPFSTDRKASGKNFVPKYQGGFGFDLDYKGFFATTTFTYVLDVWRFDVDEENLYDVANLGQFSVGSDLLNAWTSTNTNTNVPALTATNYGSAGLSDRFLRDASYLRLRNLQIGYRVPSKFLQKTFFTGLSFNLQAQNLVTFTKWKGFDPESARVSDFYQYPTPRIYTFGVDIKF